VRDLARELHRTLVGVRLDAVVLDRDTLRVTLRTRAPRRRAAATPSLMWQLHPESGHLTSAGAGSDAGGVHLGTPTRIERVHSPADERVIIIDLDAGDAPTSAARRIVIELVTNQWNAIAVGADQRITAVLRERTTHGRTLRAGAVYEPPTRQARAGASGPIDAAGWHDALGAIPPGERLSALLRFAAYASPLNAAAILGDADVTADRAALDRALDRYKRLVWTDPRAPSLLKLDGRLQPYSRPEPGAGDSESVASLLAGFDIAAQRSEAAPAESAAIDRVLTLLSHRIAATDRRVLRLRAELEGAATEAGALRHQADLLLAQLHSVPRGTAHIELDDFTGGTVELELDATLSAAENATRLYDGARRRDRAAARIPALLEAASAERERAERLIERVRAGELAAEELARIQPTRRDTSDRSAGPALPYREYRTSSGIEVRVGRGSRANDELTFRHSSPNDIWLHARDVAGAHVIMRWNRTDENPSASAIAEAAVLAAVFSRARTSGTVAVDWTRRKYVRKPRKAAPGLVIPERVKTVFVTPESALEERMRAVM
jgi:predicted ribosome quality control (RQC) complex YloA/Tae2 family protein